MQTLAVPAHLEIRREGSVVLLVGLVNAEWALGWMGSPFLYTCSNGLEVQWLSWTSSMELGASFPSLRVSWLLKHAVVYRGCPRVAVLGKVSRDLPSSGPCSLPAPPRAVERPLFWLCCVSCHSRAYRASWVAGLSARQLWLLYSVLGSRWGP